MIENVTNGMLIVDRIDNLLKERGESRVSLAEALEIKPQNISAWYTRGTIPAGDICLKIAEYLGVSVEWLLTGKESGLTSEERKILSIWNSLSDDQKHNASILFDAWTAENAAKEKKELDA